MFLYQGDYNIENNPTSVRAACSDSRTSLLMNSVPPLCPSTALCTVASLLTVRVFSVKGAEGSRPGAYCGRRARRKARRAPILRLTAGATRGEKGAEGPRPGACCGRHTRREGTWHFTRRSEGLPRGVKLWGLYRALERCTVQEPLRLVHPPLLMRWGAS